jgi:hypothetical protein
LLKSGAIKVVQDELRVVVVLLQKGFRTIAHDEVHHLPQILSSQMFQLLLQSHFIVVGHLFFAVLFEQVALHGFFLFIARGVLS